MPNAGGKSPGPTRKSTRSAKPSGAGKKQSKEKLPTQKELLTELSQWRDTANGRFTAMEGHISSMHSLVEKFVNSAPATGSKRSAPPAATGGPSTSGPSPSKRPCLEVVEVGADPVPTQRNAAPTPSASQTPAPSTMVVPPVLPPPTHPAAPSTTTGPPAGVPGMSAMPPQVPGVPHWYPWGMPYQLPPPPVNNPPVSTSDTRDREEMARRFATLAYTAAASAREGKYDVHYPHHYVRRGMKEERVGRGELTINEYVWGLIQVHNAKTTLEEHRSGILSHIQALMKDDEMYQWPAVRTWSEKVIKNIIEGDWTWDSKVDISTLRMDTVVPQKRNGQDAKRPNTGCIVELSTEVASARAGPICRGYNTGLCKIKGDHIVGGQRRVHVCLYCVMELSKASSHPEYTCYTKHGRHDNHGHSRNDNYGKSKQDNSKNM